MEGARRAMLSRSSQRTSWPSNARSTFGLSDADEMSETTPLLPHQSSPPVGPGSTGGYSGISQGKTKAQVGGTFERDAIEELEKLPALLTRSVLVFTLASCSAAFLGAMRAGFSSRITIEVCILPAAIAAVWLVIQLVVSAVRIRRVMKDEYIKRKTWIRKIRRRMRRRPESRGERASGEISLESSSPTFSTPRSNQNYSPPETSTARRRGRVRGDILETAATAAATVAAKGGGQSRSKEDEYRRDEDIERRLAPSPVGMGLAVARSKDEPSVGEKWQEPTAKKRVQEEEEKLSKAVAAAAAAAAATTQEAPLLGTMVPLKSPPTGSAPFGGQDVGEPTTMVEISSRAVRVSYLLQGWFRLWLSMAFFTVVVVGVVVLLLVNFSSLSVSIPAIGVASPVLVALAILTLHSFLMIDGDGGSAGGLAVRGGGGTRSFLALGRRPIIFLAVLCAVLLVVKVNAFERMASGSNLSFVDIVVVKMSWSLMLLPYWVATALIEAVYLRALVENYMRENLFTTLFGDRTLGFLLCCWGDADNGDRCPGSLRGVWRRWYSSSIRRRADLTPSQRSAAASLCGGLLMVASCVSAISNRIEKRTTPAWGVPVTILISMLGCAMIGAGLWRLTSAYHRSMRGGLPPPAKPLPVFFSERQGGWVVGPADPPKILIFLLGEVTLRQEGFATGGGGFVEPRENVIMF